jgi:membrane-bound ClpP family serine protease
VFLVFLITGIVGLLLLATALIFDDLLEFADVPFLSTAAIGAFLAGFGFVGLALPSSWSITLTTAVAGLSGIALGAFGGWMSTAMSRTRTDETVRGDLVIGAVGTVVNRIDADQYGEVSVTVAGHLMKYNAKSDEPIAFGTPVVVVEVLSPSAVFVTPR